MQSKLYVGNLSYTATEEDLRQLFSQAGNVKSVSVIKDRDTGRSKGFAFVEMASDDDAQKAISQLNGQSFQDRSLKVNVARPREDRPRGGGGGGGGFGGPRGGDRGDRGGRGRSW
jgi:RNA recognition motif-containing protein